MILTVPNGVAAALERAHVIVLIGAQGQTDRRGDAVMFNRPAQHRAPAAADVEQGVARRDGNGLQAKVELGFLRKLQADRDLTQI
jgi:hypothetical protein